MCKIRFLDGEGGTRPADAGDEFYLTHLDRLLDLACDGDPGEENEDMLLAKARKDDA